MSTHASIGKNCVDHPSCITKELEPSDVHRCASNHLGWDEIRCLLLVALLLFFTLLFSSRREDPTETTQESPPLPLEMHDSEQNCALGTNPEASMIRCQDSLPVSLNKPHSVKLPIQSTAEGETKAALERIFGKPFIRIRPSFLTNPETKRKLELDCYNAELRLGVEYNGIQHYVYPNPFHRDEQQFYAQQRRDQCKQTLCQQAGVYLLVVPYTVQRAQIEHFLRQQLKSQFSDLKMQ